MDLSEIFKDPKKANEAKPEEISLFLASLASIQSVLTARLLAISRPKVSSNEDKEDRLLDADQAAKILNLKKSKVYELARQKEGAPPFFYIGKYPRISETALRKWIAERSTKCLDNGLSDKNYDKGRTHQDQGENGIDLKAVRRPLRSP